MSAASKVVPYRNNYEHLEDELRRLDLLIRLRTKTLALQNQASPEGQASRVVYITPAEVEWLLDKGEVPACDVATEAMRSEVARLRGEINDRIARSQEEGVFLALPQLCRLFGHSAFERDAIVICLAPELRRKYDRLYAYMQDDITRKRPSVDLVLELLCDTEAQRWNARRLLSDSASLLSAGLLRKVNDPNSPSGSSGLAQLLELDAQIFQFLLGTSQIDARLVGLVHFLRSSGEVEQAPIDPSIVACVSRLVEHHLAPDNVDKCKLILHLHGPHGVGKRELALQICQRLNRSLLCLDMELLLARGPEAEKLVSLALREGLLQQAFVYVEHADILLQESARPLLEALAVAISEYGWLIFLGGEVPWTHKQPFTGCLFHSTALPMPDVSIRTAVWGRYLAGLTSEAAAWAGQLAAQFQLTPGQIRAAVELASNYCVMGKEQRLITAADLAKACRAQSNHKLSELAAKIEPRYGWSDIVLPEDKLAQLREICDQFRHHYKVFCTWDFGKKLSRGKGLSALFTGPSGTGKTMAAEVLAHDLELDLYKVDLSGVVSKYIGETEKNLSRIFAEAETSNAILFFDEADALFGKRIEVSDAHDRYANIEACYLLQKMEEYEGVLILASNLRENMDEAFTRRIRFVVEFPFPNEPSRLQIWKTHFPREAPVSDNIDYELLSRQFQIAGGNIKNIVLNAAFLAAANDGVIGMKHILHGSKREFEKIGKLWQEPSLRQFIRSLD
jgi:MoxR-like ATPase